jgi:branched-subunit amino acid transport protein
VLGRLAGVREVWLVVALTGAATVLIKATGPVLLGGRELPPRLFGVVELLAPAVLSALVVTQVFADERELVLDSRLVGFAAGAVAVAARAPLIVTVVVAAAATALVRFFV